MKANGSSAPMRLPAIDPMQPREFFAAYVLRRLTMNALRGLRSAYQLLGRPFRGVIGLAEISRDAADLLEIAEDQARAGLLFRTGRSGEGVKLNEQKLRNTDVGLRRAKLCPACLREKGIIPSIWILTAYTDCHVHHCELIDECPKCSAPITWARAWYHRCSNKRCRADFSKVTSRRSKQAMILLMSEIAARAEGRPSRVAPECGIRGNGEYRLQDFTDVTLFLGRQVRAIRERRPSMGGRPSGLADIRADIAAGASVLSASWKANYFDLLDRIFVAPATGKFVRISRVLPTFYRALLGSPGREFLVEAIAEYLVERQPQLIRRLSGDSNTVRRCHKLAGLISIRAASEQTHIGMAALDRAAKQLGIDLVGARTCRLVSVEELQRIVIAAGSKVLYIRETMELGRQFRRGADFPNPELRATWPTLLRAERLPQSWCSGRLGITEEPFRQLVSSDMFSRWSDGSVPPLTKEGVCTATYAQFEKALASLARRVTCSDPFEFFASTEAADRGKGWGICRILKAVFSGDLQRVQLLETQKGLERIRVSRSEVARLLAAERLAKMGKLLDRQGAARLIGETDSHVVLHLARAEMVRVQGLEPGRTALRLFEEDSLLEFKAHHASVDEVRKLIPGFHETKSPRAIIRELEGFGIYPVTGPTVDGGPKTFYRRTDIDSLIQQSAYRRVS